jgi:hypothetical protein
MSFTITTGDTINTNYTNGQTITVTPQANANWTWDYSLTQVVTVGNGPLVYPNTFVSPSVWLSTPPVDEMELRRQIREEIMRELAEMPVDVPVGPRRIRLRD